MSTMILKDQMLIVYIYTSLLLMHMQMKGSNTHTHIVLHKSNKFYLIFPLSYEFVYKHSAHAIEV